MNKLTNFLNETTEITNGNKVVSIVATLALLTMAQVLNYKLYKAKVAIIDKDMEITVLKIKEDIKKY